MFCGQSQLNDAQWPTADLVEVRLRSKTVATRVRVDLPRCMGAGDGAVDLMIDLVLCYLCLPPSALLVAFGTGDGRWPM